MVFFTLSLFHDLGRFKRERGAFEGAAVRFDLY